MINGALHPDRSMRATQPRRPPGSLDELRGLRAARWIRESTAGQYDRYGPESQHEQMDRFAERYGLVDSGIVYTVAESGRTVWRSTTMAEMLAAARTGSFDVLLTGYFDRWQRNLRRTLELVEDTLHPSGVTWVMCDRGLLSSDPRDWDQMVTEAHEAERYSRRLGERITDGYAAKFRHLADPGGHAPLGFLRLPPTHVLAIDTDKIGVAVRMFEQYASGTRSIEEVASGFGLNDRRVNDMLKNPVYNGWVARKGELIPAPWRSNPPVSDELWERVAELRSQRARHAGRQHPARPDLLRGLLYCVCGQRVRTDGTMGTPPRQRKMHPRHEDCADWGPKASYSSEAYEPWIVGQVTGIRVDQATIDQVIRAVSTPKVMPLDGNRARMERMKRELALDHAAGKIADETYLARVAVIRQEMAALATSEPPAMAPADKVVAKLRQLPETWAKATPAGRVELLNSIYERITVKGREFVSARLTSDAYALGLALALPEQVEPAQEWALARPTGVGRHQLASHDLLAAFLTRADETRGEGLFAWIPERPAGELLGGYVRPDAIAGVRIGGRAIVLFIERDLGTERGEILPGKIRRYRSLFGGRSPLALSVGFVVESGRRERSIQHQLRPSPTGPRMLTITAERLVADPIGAHWADGLASIPTRGLEAFGDTNASVLAAGCLTDPDALAAFDDRAAQAMSVLRPHLR